MSTATVSNVFSGNKPVNPELRQRVQAAAKALSFHPDRNASQLRSGQTRTVGVLVPDLDDVFFTSLISRIEVMAGKDGYDVIISSSRDDVELERSRLRALLSWRPAGLIAVPCSDRPPGMLRAEAGHLPMVLADRLTPDECLADTVMIDNFTAGQMAARHLTASGHRDFVVAASNLGISPIRERVRGATDEAAQSGAAATVLELGSNAERGAAVFAGWLDGNPPPSAVFALTNVTTLAVLGGLARRQIAIPRQTSLIGFDDYPWMSARMTPLTAVRQPVDEMASQIWKRLTARIGGDASPPQRSVLDAALQVRRSVLDRVAAAETGKGQDAAARPAVPVLWPGH